MESIEDKKFRGGYYTPTNVADFITSWACEGNEKEILEPSCGDGIFIKSILDQYDQKLPNILGVELNEMEAEKALEENVEIINSDYFTLYQNVLKNNKYDIVFGNPPFIRYQNFNQEYREKAMNELVELGFSPTKMINIWLPFLVLNVHLLNENGKLGMVIPAEIMQVDYAAEARQYLLEIFEEINIITFKNNIFEKAQQEVILLLAKKKSNTEGIRMMEVDNSKGLSQLKIEDTPLRPKKPSKEKWLKYFLKEDDFLVYNKISESNKILKFAEVAEVNVGVVTGQNKFFVINKEIEDNYHLDRSVIDIVSRSEQLKSIVLNKDDLTELYINQKNTRLFFPNKNLDDHDNRYIKFGEKNNYHSGYKTRIRKEWYRVPISWKPEAFFLRQVHKYPKIIINNTDATCTDTIHKIRSKDGYNIENLTFSFLNSFTLLDCELQGRSYGGGVLTFEPGEVRKLRIPYYNFNKSEIKEIHQLSKTDNIEKVIEYVDKIVLENYLGLDDSQITNIRNSWNTLNSRRLDR